MTSTLNSVNFQHRTINSIKKTKKEYGDEEKTVKLQKLSKILCEMNEECGPPIGGLDSLVVFL